MHAVTETAVELDGLVVQRGRVEILHDLSLRISAGSVTGLMGPSGSGKTTLMRTLVGLQRVRAGRVTVLGRPGGDPHLRGQVAYAPQGSSVYVDLSVEENVRYFAACLGADRGQVARVVDQVELSAYAHRLAGSLSGGQRSRVSLAIALLGAPRLLVLDEPTVGLDPILRDQLWRLFAELAAGGLTLLISSHVMDEAERCDDVVLLRDGRLLTQESPASLRARTGADSLDTAFLRLVRPDGASP